MDGLLSSPEEGGAKQSPSAASRCGGLRLSCSADVRSLRMTSSHSAGTIFTVNAQRLDSLHIPAAYSQLRIWRDTAAGSVVGGGGGSGGGKGYTSWRGILGHEWDEDIDNGFRPVGEKKPALPLAGTKQPTSNLSMICTRNADRLLRPPSVTSRCCPRSPPADGRSSDDVIAASGLLGLSGCRRRS